MPTVRCRNSQQAVAGASAHQEAAATGAVDASITQISIQIHDPQGPSLLQYKVSHHNHAPFLLCRWCRRPKPAVTRPLKVGVALSGGQAASDIFDSLLSVALSTNVGRRSMVVPSARRPPLGDLTNRISREPQPTVSDEEQRRRDEEQRKKDKRKKISGSRKKTKVNMVSQRTGGSSSKDKLLRKRVRYENMDESSREILMETHQDSTDVVSGPGGLTQAKDVEKVIHLLQVIREPNEIEFDQAIFEPSRPDYVAEGCSM
ncbi:hypothetical protein EJB05_01557, partial [Eragrostis curvula]